MAGRALRDGVFSCLKQIANPLHERPLSVRSRKADPKRRVNGNVQYRTGRQEVTSHAGLELIREYLKRIGFTAMLRRAAGSRFPAADFGAVPMVLCLLRLILVGGRGISHLRHEQGDPVLARFAGLARLPAPRTASAWMQRAGGEDVARLAKLNEELVGNALRQTGAGDTPSRWTGPWSAPDSGSRAPTGATTRTDGRCPATSRLPPARLRRGRSSGF